MGRVVGSADCIDCNSRCPGNHSQRLQENTGMSGNVLRLKRLGIEPGRRLVIFPLDHGVTCGPIAGLVQVESAIRLGVEGRVDALVLHKGMLRLLDKIPSRLPGIFMHLSASTQLGPNVHHKVLVGSVEEAIRRGADGVSIHVNMGDSLEPQMLCDFGEVGAACAQWNIPLLVMIYAKGTENPTHARDSAIAHAARVAAELGADCIKLPTPSDDEILREITGSLPVPVVVAGGTRSPDTLSFLGRVEKAIRAGAGGVAIGRNVFQHERPEAVMHAICSIVHRGVSAEKAWEGSLN